ncbi:putative nitrilase/nitrile hydratase [Wickerhamomyces ciferrii]|uniref:Nitrilase/nitrile hydratase n=1 Tax=Wickerhamomyces ciferrii (strain ATCC 14091 / BCRC 22168 / CBS 111 / JCM 3599 / NBRC 0793 / NRRL Y-1031 F-60-10) TaxID=1206466 RepID=K0KKW9_WICCF|nr:putative nitrilase/nitrile hydratase [Wickerhamomyces ciferrii]CCH42782.1 putative nitrilase/nitrile hydratase [Wickerhamomyces ciferrii]
MVLGKVAALQVGSEATTKKTLEKILSYEEELIELKPDLVVIPEATLGGYPKGSTFGSYLGYRLPEGREQFFEYFKQSIKVPQSEEISILESFSKKIGSTIAIGVIENGGTTLYCTLVYIDPKLGYVGKHRKLVPTATERLVWGAGDGSTLPVIDSKIGKIGGGICWENYVPLFRSAYYAKGLDIWVAPTVDTREIWRVSMRTIAYEARTFLVSAVQFQPPAPEDKTPEGWVKGENLINGGSVIVNPYGEVIAGPLLGKEGIISAEIDLDDVVKARFDFDPAGHYARGDVFKLTVNEGSRDVEFK